MCQGSEGCHTFNLNIQVTNESAVGTPELVAIGYNSWVDQLKQHTYVVITIPGVRMQGTMRGWVEGEEGVGEGKSVSLFPGTTPEIEACTVYYYT